MNEIHFLPCPLRGRCPQCGAKHEKGEKHDEKSAYYMMRVRRGTIGNAKLDTGK